jgi:hypothetical protein
MIMDATREQAQHLIDAVNDALATPTHYRDDTPLPVVGTAPPVAQPGRPPMSQRATDTSVMMLAGAGSVSMVSLSAGVLMYLSQYADPIVCGIVFGAPTTVVLALARLVGRAKAAAPDVHHHTYLGTVDQRTVNTDARGVWAKNQVRGTR